MEHEADAVVEQVGVCDEARNELIKLTSEYYTLRAQYKTLSPDQNSRGGSQDMRNVLIVDRLEEIAQETKLLLPSVYPQLDLKPKPAAPRARRAKSSNPR